MLCFRFISAIFTLDILSDVCPYPVLLLNHCSDIFGRFFDFCFKSKHSTFFSSG